MGEDPDRPIPAEGRDGAAIDAPGAIRVTRLEVALVIGLTLLGIALRITLWDTQSIPGGDGFTYIWMAKSLAGAPPVDSLHPYGYPVLILLAHLAIEDWVLAARIVPFAFGILYPLLVWALARCLVENRWLRLLPTAAAALTPLPIRYSLTAMSDVPYMVFLLSMFVLSYRKRFLWAGVMAGIAYTIRPEALLAVVVLAAIHWRRPRQALILLGGAALLVVPYVTTIGVTQGTWSLTRKTVNIGDPSWQANETRVGEETVSPSLPDRIREHGGDVARNYPKRGAAVLGQLLAQGGWTAVVAGAAGLAGPATLLLAGMVQIVALPLSFIGERVRYVFPFLPLLWVAAMAWVDRLRSPGLRVTGALLVAAGLAASAYLEREQYTLNDEGYFPELVEAGRWLSRYATPTTVVYDRKPYTAFYSGGIYRFPRTGTYDEVIDDVVAEGGDYLVANDWVLERWRPELLPLVEDPETVAREKRLAPIYYSASRRGLQTVIYRVVRPGGPPEQPDEDRIRVALVQVLEERRRTVGGP